VAKSSEGMSGYIPQLDGLRGIAILSVLLFHVGSKLPALHLERATWYGWAGVDLFFVISGFLITTILLESAGSERYFRNFYVRRVLRIWPLYFALLIFVFALLPWIVPALRERIFAQCHPWQSYFLFLQNFFVHEFGIGPVGVTWSLAIEEQFYLVWPVVILFLPRKLLLPLLLALAVFSPVARVVAQAHGASIATVYTHTIFRLDSISAGALLAVWVKAVRFNSARTVRLFGLLTAAGAVACLVTFWLESDRAASASLRFTSLAVLFFGLVGSALLAGPGTLLYRILSAPWLRYTGKICFGLYLLHVTVFDTLSPERLRFLGNGWAGNLGVLIIDFVAVFLLASGSWHLLESPILRLKHNFEYGRSHETPDSCEAEKSRFSDQKPVPSPS
jgi:peptidoglycan/LPS O-acetylase OafA/YrhL